jgi:hypothetical protein
LFLHNNVAKRAILKGVAGVSKSTSLFKLISKRFNPDWAENLRGRACCPAGGKAICPRNGRWANAGIQR